MSQNGAGGTAGIALDDLKAEKLRDVAYSANVDTTPARATLGWRISQHRTGCVPTSSLLSTMQHRNYRPHPNAAEHEVDPDERP